MVQTTRTSTKSNFDNSNIIAAAAGAAVAGLITWGVSKFTSRNEPKRAAARPVAANRKRTHTKKTVQ